MHDRAAILALLPATRKQIRERLGTTMQNVDDLVERMLAAKLLHIGGWGARRAHIYHAGPGQNVERTPYKRLPKTPEQNAKYWANRKAKRVPAAPAPTPSPWAGRYIPPQHPLLAAFYGK